MEIMLLMKDGNLAAEMELQTGIAPTISISIHFLEGIINRTNKEEHSGAVNSRQCDIGISHRCKGAKIRKNLP